LGQTRRFGPRSATSGLPPMNGHCKCPSACKVPFSTAVRVMSGLGGTFGHHRETAHRPARRRPPRRPNTTPQRRGQPKENAASNVSTRIPTSSAGAVAHGITCAAPSDFSQSLCGHPHDIASSGSFRSFTERLEVTPFPASPQGLPHEVKPPGADKPQPRLFWIDWSGRDNQLPDRHQACGPHDGWPANQ
jgi:hypothetical protein